MPLSVTARGDLVYRPDGEVLEDFFWDRASRFVCIQGPIGSGTSSASCHRIWRLACEQEADFDGVRRSRWIVSRDTYKNLRETTIKTWLDWFPENEWGHFIRAEPGYHQLRQPAKGGGWELRDHPSGDGTRVDCEVIFLALPDPDVAESVLASYEITGFFVNEGQFFEKEVIDELLSRCSRFPSMRNGPGATWYGGWMDMNAPVEGHWVPYMRGDVPLPAEMTDEEKLPYEKPENWRFVVQPPALIEKFVDGKIVYEENPKAENQKHLKEPYLEKIQGKKKEWIDRRILNKVALQMHGKPVYPTFMEADHVHKMDVEPRQGIPIVVGLDFGRDPAAAFLQNVNGTWTLHSELIGDNESASLFAPRVSKHLARYYPGFRYEFWGDPRGADGNQKDEQTAYDVFQINGMRVLPATTDNNVDLRRDAVETALDRRNGFKINPSVSVAKRGFAGGYHYRKIKGVVGVYAPQPVKNTYSHIVEAVENGLIGGGEGYALMSQSGPEKRAPSPVKRHKVRMRRARA